MVGSGASGVRLRSITFVRENGKCAMSVKLLNVE